MAISYLTNKDIPQTAIQQAPKATTDVPQAPSSSNEIVRGLANQVTRSIQPGTSSFFDPRYEATVNSINQQKALWGSGQERSKQRIGEDYTTNVGEAGEINTRNQSSLQNKLANQGIGWSGVNVSEQGRLGEAYQKVLGQLTQGKTRGLEDLEFANTLKQTEFQNAMSAAELDKAERQSAYEKEQAMAAAQAKAAKDAADANRLWMDELTKKITSLAQPVPAPTGKMSLPPAQPKAIVQKAIAAVPPPTPPAMDKETVRETQYYLNRIGGYGLSEDGMLGPKTTKALIEWKTKNGLPADTNIDEKTAAMLMNQSQGMNLPTGLGGTVARRSGPQA